MSRAIHLISNNVAGCGLSDGRCLPGSGISRRSVSVSLCMSHCDYKTFTQTKIASLNCYSRGSAYACNANSGSYRRNPDFSRQNKHGFSRSGNRKNEERDASENDEESEFFPSRNGPLLSLSSTPKFQATAAPGPREREIVELFRKVQAKLRERSTTKEEKKIEEFQGKRKESETVDSLLKLLRKHSVQQGKKNSSNGNRRDFILDQDEQNSSLEEEKSTNLVDPNNTLKDEPLEHESRNFSRPASNFQRRSPIPLVKFQSGSFEEEKSSNLVDSNNTLKDESPKGESQTFSRPASNFQRRSPVPHVKFQSIYSDSDTVNSVSNENINRKREQTQNEPKIKYEPKLEPEPVSTFSDGNVFDGISEDVISDPDEVYTEDDADEQEETVNGDLSAMKLTELRALAKSRGLKGFSKLKKLELVELLRGGSI